MDGGEGWGFVSTLDPGFAPIVARLEQQAERHPDLYRLRVLAAGLLGYLVLGAMFALPTAVFTLLFAFVLTASLAVGDTIRAAVALVAAGATLFWIFRLPSPSPKGVEITRSQAPALFALIERTRQAMGGPPVHEVRIADGVNAHSARLRSHGVRVRNVLVIGLPLFHALPPAELTAQVAHELGHLTLRHGHFIYGVRMRWRQMGQRIPAGVLARLLRRFFGWYGPWFLAQAQVLLRRREFEADALAARTVGGQLLATSHRRTAFKFVKYEYLSRKAAEQGALYHDLGLIDWPVILSELAPEHERDQAALAEILAHPAKLTDSHPPLMQRLVALGDDMRPEPPFETCAAAPLLGPLADTALRQLLAERAWLEKYEIASLP